MIPHKPHNHVAEAMEAIRKTAAMSSPWPDIPEDLVLHLEATYPPEVYRPSVETLEEHLQYAGKVELVRVLRDVFERQAKEAGDDSEEGEWDAFQAEHS